MADKTTTAEGTEMLSGNEAIARGAWEAGVKLASAYPGTPSTEILETLAKYEDIYCEWSPNEKVAVEVGAGAAFAGGRAMVCMKHVGLNVAADPFFSLVLHRGGSGPGGRHRPTTPACTALRTSRTTATTPSSPGSPSWSPLTASEAQGVHRRRLRPVREVRHSRAASHDHEDLALQEPGQAGRAHCAEAGHDASGGSATKYIMMPA